MHDELSALVRRVDEDRWLAGRFAAAPVRTRLIALYAAHYEIARTGEVVREPGLGEIRLQWWRDALQEIADRAPPRRHPIVEAVARVLKYPPALAALQAIADARVRDLDSAPFATLSDLDAYADATAGELMMAAIDLAAPAAGRDQIALTRAAGRAWAYAGLLRTAAGGRVLFAPELSRDTLLARARACHAEARTLARAMPSATFPAFGYVALVPGYLRALQRGETERPLLARQLRLVAAAATGGL